MRAINACIMSVLTVACGTPRALAGAAGRPALTAALSELQSGDTAEAASLLEAVVAEDPGSAPAWRALGTAYQRSHANQRAIRAFRRALSIEPDSPQTFYNLGSVYAAEHDARNALAWLRRARATRRYDMTQMSVDENLAPLLGDSRFAALLPTAREFEHPFVEKVRIIREWRGEAANDQFGWIARNIGDVDGDGVNDVVISAPTHGARGSHAGRIYVYSTGSGRLLWTADGEQGDELGTGVEAAGDTDGDGVPDVVAAGPAGRGIARVYSGRDGRVLHEFRSPSVDEMFGNHVSGAGDVDGDGYADVIVGSPGREGEAKSPGHAYVYSGRTGKLLLALAGERAGDQFGSTVAGYRRGEQQYLVVGAPRAGPRQRGRVYVYRDGSGKAAFTIDSDDTGSALGAMFVSIPGDLDGDGVSDVYASDWSNEALGFSTGRIYVHSGRTGERLLTLTGESAGDGFGTSPSAAGDVDHDGYADLIIGAWQYGKAAVAGGRAYLYSGRDGRLLRTYTSRVPGETFGFDAVGLGDVDGDGTVDLLITSGWSGVHGHHSGRAFVVSSGVRVAP
jgi:FG-GAP repeat/Tetratricopeptide repeat